MKISSFFSIKEFVPKQIYDRYGDNSMWFIDRRIILLADFIRSRFKKPMLINTWHINQSFNYRGFRPPDCTTGGLLSQHKFGRAIDFNVAGMEVKEVYDDIVKNFDIYSKAGLTTIEDYTFTASWTHVDIRQTNSDKLLIVKP